MNNGPDQERATTRPGRLRDIAGHGTAVGNPPSSRWPYDVIITKIDNGFIVRIGCKTLAGKDWDEVSNGLALYWIYPEAAEKLYLKK